MATVPLCDAPDCGDPARFELRSTVQLYESDKANGKNIDADGETSIVHACSLEHLDQVSAEKRAAFLARFTVAGKSARTK